MKVHRVLHLDNSGIQQLHKTKMESNWRPSYSKIGQYTCGQRRLGYLAKASLESFIVKNLKSIGKLYDMVIEDFAALKDKNCFSY